MGQLSTAASPASPQPPPPPADPLQAFFVWCPSPSPLPLLGGPRKLAMTMGPSGQFVHQRVGLCLPIGCGGTRWGGQQPQEPGRRKLQWLLCGATGPLLPARFTFPGVALYPVTPQKGGCWASPHSRLCRFHIPGTSRIQHHASATVALCVSPKTCHPSPGMLAAPALQGCPLGGGAIRAGTFPFPAFEEAASWLDSISH